MKQLTKLLTAALVVLAACTKIVIPSDSVPINNAGEYAIMFNKYPTTKAVVSSTSGTGYDNFSLFVWNSNNTLVMNPYTVHARGTDYVYDDVAGQKLEYFSRTANYYDFLGVIPTTHPMTLDADSVTVNSLVSFKVDDARVSGTLIADSPEEFLFASARVPKADYGNIVDLPFKHGNAVIYLGFSSDRTDTKLLDYVPGIPATPEVRDTVDTWFNLKRNTNVNGSATTLKGPNDASYVDNAALPDALVAEIKSYYSIDNGTPGDYDLHLGNTQWPSSVHKTLRIVKDIPDNYKLNVELLNGTIVTFFDGLKYLKDNGYDLQPRTSGGKPALWDQKQILLDAFVNGAAYTAVFFDWAVSTVNINVNNAWENHSVIEYTINVTPAIDPVPGIDGVRMFTADSLGVNNVPTDTLYCVHRPHTTVADAVVKADTTVFKNRQTSKEVITYSLPITTTLSSTPVWSATTFYALPGDANLNWLVVKLSYIYNGITTYDVRVPIKLPDGGLKQGKYYKYEIHITSTSTGTNDPGEASDEKDEIIIEGLDPIRVQLSVTDYDLGANEKITI